MIIKIVKLIESNQHIFEIKPYGAVDVRTSESETEDEKQASIRSLESYNFAVDKKNILRLVTIIERDTIHKASLDANLLFEETIDLLKRQPVTKIRNCEGAGYWVNMDSGETIAFLKPDNTNIPFFDHVYQMSLGSYSAMFGEQIISSKRNVEAVEAFIRSIHWYNNSHLQKRMYLKFLYKWIAIETIAKASDNDDIIPKLCLILGFPLSKHSTIIPKNKMAKLASINGYKHYKKLIKNEFLKCKKIRNAIVHSGFKETNLLNENLKLKLFIIDSSYNIMIKNIEKIICSGKNTIKEVWNTMHEYIINDEKDIVLFTNMFINQISMNISKSEESDIENLSDIDNE